jgi:hypothetical protein
VKTFQTVLLSYLIGLLIFPPALGRAAGADASASSRPPTTAKPYARLYSGSVPASARASLAVNVTPGSTADSPSKANEPAAGPTEIAALERDRFHVELPTSIQSGLKPRSPLNAMRLGRASAFIENRGQFDRRVKFQLKGSGQTLWLTAHRIVFDSIRSKDKADRNPKSRFLDSRKTLAGPHHVERLVFTEDFVDARRSPTIEAGHPLPGLYNYFIGNDPKKWRTDVRGYAEITYRNVWDGVDLRLYRNGANLEQEFVVKPGGDFGKVRLSFKGIDGLKLADDGSLLIQTAFGDIRETQPRIYQEISGKRVAVDGRFKITTNSSYTFEVGRHNPQYALVIDPTLLYSTFLGGSAGLSGVGGGFIVNEQGRGIAVDGSGSAYITGSTASTDFPVTPGAYQTSSLGVFITKLTPLADNLVYSTYLGDARGIARGDAGGVGIAVDSAGEAYVVGNLVSPSSTFPTTPSAFENCSSATIFFTKLSALGDSLVYSTCLGTGFAGGLALDESSGRAYLTGWTENTTIATTSGAFQPSRPAAFRVPFFSVIDPSLTGTPSLVYSTYLGGSVDDWGEGNAVAVDSSHMAYIAGSAAATDFPVTSGAYQTKLNRGAPTGNRDAFVAKLNPNASGAASLIYATYLGGSSTDEADGIAVDAPGNAYVTGATGANASVPFPITSGAAQTAFPGNCGFVTKLNATGNNVIYSTFMGTGTGRAIAVDAAGNAYITGINVANFVTPTPDAAQPSYGGGRSDGFVTKLDPSGALIYASFLGGLSDEDSLGIAIDAPGDAYVTGYTASVDFPVSQGAYQPTINAGGVNGPDDAFVTKFALGAPVSFYVTGALPSSGGNAGAVTATIEGAGFNSGATVKLSRPGQPDIPGFSVGPGVIEGRTIAATFYLQGSSPGSRNLTVINRDGTTATSTNGFLIQQGGSPSIWVDIVGQRAMRGGQFQNYFVVYGNRGNVDGRLISLAVKIPDFLHWQLLGQQIPIYQYKDAGNIVRVFRLPIIPSSGSGTFVLRLGAPNLAHKPFVLQAWVNPK